MNENENKKMVSNAQVAFLYTATALLVVGFVSVILLITGNLGSTNQKTITVSADGEVYAKPDIADITFNVQADNKDLALAQEEVTKKTSAILDQLKASAIDDKDIQTTDYQSYPKYEYHKDTKCIDLSCPTNPVIVGYTVSNSDTVTVRDITKAGEIFKLLGNRGVSNLNGPNFRVENPDSYVADAQAIAAGEAKAKATKIVEGQGGTLGSIVSITPYSNGGGYPAPMMATMDSVAGAETKNAVAPTIAVGQNKITGSVTITYRIH